MANKRYRLYIDESGDHAYKKIEDKNRRYLGLCACYLELARVNDSLIPGMDSFKRSHFDKHDPDEPVLLHRNDSINRRAISCAPG